MYVYVTDRLIRAISNWLDRGSEKRDPMHQMHIRCDKLVEEAGEVHRAIVGMEGSNPRKGVYATREDVAKELLDTASSALFAYYHVTQRREVLRDLASHINGVFRRASLDEKVETR